MKKIVLVIGARPQFIKHAPVLLALKKKFECKTIHTGQHYDSNMSEVFFSELQIPLPEYDLGIKATHHGEQTGLMMMEIEKILIAEKPAAIVVYGDTNSTLAGALAASKLHIPIVHIEAGLRSFNRQMPEEVNRVLTDHIAEILFCPNEESKNNLQHEGISKNVVICGDVMKDILQLCAPLVTSPEPEPYLFVTLHRPYNTDDVERLSYCLSILNQLNVKIIFAIHPRTWHRAKQYNIDLTTYHNIKFIEPVGYLESLAYQKYADCVVTDSGGIQKEAYWLKRKCITIRKETEWIETLEDGWNTLLFEDLSKLPLLITSKLPEKYDEGLYGNGSAAQMIADTLTKLV
ncbi:MAG: UDP-N-acetylglucosamine 2-epimerase (non-hydrolyzing) [Spirosomataceae bacterium]